MSGRERSDLQPMVPSQLPGTRMALRRALAASTLAITSVITFLALDRLSGDRAETDPTESARATARTSTTQLSSNGAGAAANRSQIAADAPYRPGEIMVAGATLAQLEALASAHDGTVLRAPGRAGIGLVAVAPDLMSDVLLDLASEGGGLSAAPNGQIRAAGRGGRQATTDTTDTTDTTTSKGKKSKSTTESTAEPTSSADTGTAPDEATPTTDATDGSTSPDTGAVTEAAPSTDDTATAEPAVGRAQPLQWHLDAVGAPVPGEIDVSQIVVAVLDSGVAYAAHTAPDGSTHAAAASLQRSSIVAPHDFVDDDALALDEHQHGTHIASIIASSGTVEGVAPGAALMPLRVLDADCTGSELDLIEALYHAVDNGADVVNMSLSFPLGYVPSAGLRTALQAVHDADIVMVAASGNEGGEAQSWPAASPLVVGVSSFSPTDAGAQVPPSYANLGLGLDIVAPGGDLGIDANADGIADGIVAETIDLNRPDSLSLWMIAGTSQAAAVVTGAVADLLASGVTPGQVVPLLQGTADTWDAYTDLEYGGEVHNVRLYGSSFVAGTGAGALQLGAALDRASLGGLVTDPGYALTMMPYIQRSEDGARIRPAARMWAVDRLGNPPPIYGAAMGVRIWDDVDYTLSGCTFADDGSCIVVGAWVPAGTEAAWVFQAEGIGQSFDSSTMVVRPGTAMVLPDALELVTAALDGTGLATSPMGFEWARTSDPVLGEVDAGWTVLNMGSGLATSPMGLVATLGGLSPSSTSTITLDLDGTGIATSPMGLIDLNVLRFDGSGLAVSPMGLWDPNASTRFDIVMVGGSGLATSPMRFQPIQVADPDATSWDDAAISLDSRVVRLDGSALSGSSLGLTSTGLRIDAGGWTTGTGLEGVSALLGSGAVSSALTMAGPTDAGGDGAQPVAPFGSAAGLLTE